MESEGSPSLPEPEAAVWIPCGLRIALRSLGCEHAAEEAVQDALLKMMRAYPSFRGESRFSTWATAILINVIRDRSRRRMRSPATEPLMEDTAFTQGKPEHRICSEELAGAVRNAVSELPEKQRETVLLMADEEMTAELAAEILMTTPQNIYATLSVARKTLRQRLATRVE